MLGGCEALLLRELRRRCVLWASLILMLCSSLTVSMTSEWPQAQIICCKITP